MEIHQDEIRLKARGRGCHLVTEEIVRGMKSLAKIDQGVCHLFLLHTSASLTLNENADPSVLVDMERHLSEMVPDGAPHFTHTAEGDDDMSAHVKASLMGAALTIPVTGGRLNLGTWQGVYLCEHRYNGGSRRIVATIFGA